MRLSPYFIPVILGLTMTAPVVTPASAQVAVGITVNFAPPPIPVYVQPPIPAEGYLWVPGYWAYDPVTGYYWVPGTWVRPPAVGLLWTPPYWGFEGGVYGFHAGYWGPHVGFYGGVNYGFGYGGVGFEGAVWDGGVLSYNRSVTNISNTHIANVYNKTVVNSRPGGAAFNGAGGVTARPTPAEAAAAKEPHQARTAEQTQHAEAAKGNPELRVSVNRGKPAVAATAKPSDFKGPGTVAATKAGRGAAHSAAVQAPNGGVHKTAAEKPAFARHAGKPVPKKAEATAEGQKPKVERPAAARHTAPPRDPTLHSGAVDPAARHATPHPNAAPHPAAAPRPAPVQHPANNKEEKH